MKKMNEWVNEGMNDSTTMDTPAGSLKMILVLRASLALLRVSEKIKRAGA